MIRALLLSLCVLATGCASVKRNEFAAVAPESVAVVIGYQVTGSPSVDPKLANSAYIAGLLTPGLGGLALMLGSATINDLLRTKDPIVMIDELNTAVYTGIEQALVAKGYRVQLLKTVPVDYRTWNPRELPQLYLEQIAMRYALDEATLAASGADAVLYLEYRVDAHIDEEMDLHSLRAADLRVNQVLRSVVAFSAPPRNARLYVHNDGRIPFWNRAMLDPTVEAITELGRWPARTP